MRRQTCGVLFALATVVALGACASPRPTLEIPDYARVVRNGQELFCNGPEWQYPYPCFTRAEAEERARVSDHYAGNIAPPPVLENMTSMYHFSPSGR